MRAADQVRAVLAQEVSGASVERNRKVPAEVAIRHDVAVLVAKQQHHDWKTVCVLTESRRAHHTAPQLLLTADQDFQRAQSFPGSA